MQKVNGKYSDHDTLVYALEVMKVEKEKWYSFIPKKISFFKSFSVRFQSLIVIDLFFRSIIKRHEDKLIILDASLLERIERINDRLSRNNYNDTNFRRKEVDSIIELIDGIIASIEISIEKYNE